MRGGDRGPLKAGCEEMGLFRKLLAQKKSLLGNDVAMDGQMIDGHLFGGCAPCMPRSCRSQTRPLDETALMRDASWLFAG